MKENLFKIIGIIALILIIPSLINLFINYSILNKICKSNEEFKRSINNYYYVHNQEYSQGVFENIKTEIYYHDGIYLSKTYTDDKFYVMSWFDSNTNETYGIDSTGNETSDVYTGFTEDYKNILLNGKEESNKVISAILWQNLFTNFGSNDEYYVIKYNDSSIYIDKETNLINKFISGDVTSTFDIKLDSVTSEDVKKENI